MPNDWETESKYSLLNMSSFRMPKSEGLDEVLFDPIGINSDNRTNNKLQDCSSYNAIILQQLYILQL